MKGSDGKTDTDRRGFLKLIGTGTAAGAATAIAAGSAAAETAPQDGAPSEGKDGLYRETAHVKTYYDLAKF